MTEKETSKTTHEPSSSLHGLVELFDNTQTTMQAQAAGFVDIALVVRNWLFGWYIVEFEQAGADRKQHKQ